MSALAGAVCEHPALLIDSPAPVAEAALFERIAQRLEACGYGIFPAAVPSSLAVPLQVDLQCLDAAHFQSAGIGRREDFALDTAVRSDRIAWLSGQTPATQAFLAWIERLRLALNRRLFLGLFDYEAHYASYPPGARYRKHVDAFRGRGNRVLSTVVYLNPEWGPTDGGELLLYDPDTDAVLERVLPLYGQMVIFLSEVFPHEVLPAARERCSIAGWFRVNGSTAGWPDPPR